MTRLAKRTQVACVVCATTRQRQDVVDLLHRRESALCFTVLTQWVLGVPNAIASGFEAVWAGKHALERGRGLQVFALALILGSLLALAAGPWAIVSFGWSVYWLMLALIPMGVGAGTMGSANQTQTMMDVPRPTAAPPGGLQQMTQRITTAELGVIAIFIIAAPLPAILFWRSPRITQPA